MKKILLILYFINFINIKNQYSHDEEINNTINNNTDKNILNNKLNSNLPSTIDNKNPEINIPKEPDNKSLNIIKKKINQQDNNNDNDLQNNKDNQSKTNLLNKKNNNTIKKFLIKKENIKKKNKSIKKKTIKKHLRIPMKNNILKKRNRSNKNLIAYIILSFVGFILIILCYKAYKSQHNSNRETPLSAFLKKNFSTQFKTEYFSNYRYNIIESNKDSSKFQYMTEKDIENLKISDVFIENQINFIKNRMENIRNIDNSIFVKPIDKNIYCQLIKNKTIYSASETQWNKFINPLKEKIKDMDPVPIISFNEKDEIIINFDTSNTLIKEQDIEKLITKFQLNNYEKTELISLSKQQFIHSLIKKDILIQKMFQTIKIIEGYFLIAQNVIDLNKKRHKLKKNIKHFIKIKNIPAYITFKSFDDKSQVSNEIELLYYDVYDKKFIFKIDTDITLNFETNTINSIWIYPGLDKRNKTITILDNSCFFDYNEHFILQEINLSRGGLIINKDQITKKK